jgi:Cytidylyltransferase family
MLANRRQDAFAPFHLKPQPQKQEAPSKVSRLSPSIARVLTAVVLLPILIASILIPRLDLLFVALVVAALVIALFEFWLLAKRQQVKADVGAGYLGAAALLTIFYFTEPGKWIDFGMMQGVILILTMGSLAAAMVRGAPFERMIMSVGTTVLGVLYVVVLGGHLIAVLLPGNHERRFGRLLCGEDIWPP